MSDVVDKLDCLQLSIISQSFVEKVINSQYSYHAFPVSYESTVMPDINFSSIINEACELLNLYLQNQPSMHILWDQFVCDDTYRVYPKPLSCLLNCYINNAINDIDDDLSRKNGLSAARLFFLASTFKSNTNNEFYHCRILQQCSELIKVCINMLHGSDNVQLQNDEKHELIADLLAVVRDLAIMVKRFKFIDESTSLDFIVDVLIDVTRLERNSGLILKQVPTDLLSYSSLAFNAYNCLMYMFNDNCGTVYDVCKKIMQYLVSGLLVEEQHEMKLTNKEFNVIRDHHLSFIQELNAKLGNSFDCILEILLQNLLHRGPDRCDLKLRQLQIILEVWRLCPNDVKIKIKYYLFRLVYDKDYKIRIVALDTLFKLLSEPEESITDDPQLLPLIPATKHELIVAVILSSFKDPIITVRVKALSLFAALTASSFDATSHYTSLAKRVLVDPYLHVEHLNQTLFCKKDFYGFYEHVNNSFSDFDPNYISSFEVYPGSEILLHFLDVHAHEERVNVRRLSFTLLCNLFLINKKFIHNKYLSLLVSSCSDCALSIRKVAVSGLTSLVLKYPDNQDVLKYWFKGLIHLVGDHDKKIQELTVECMDQVILQNIEPYNAELIDGNVPLCYLPWHVLRLYLDNASNDGVCKYMMKLCEKWHAKGLLTNNIVKNVMTYVDSLSDKWAVQSLCLLQLISHQLSIKNISPIIKYFDAHFDLWFMIEGEDPTETNVMQTHAQITLDVIFLNYKYLDGYTRQRFLDLFEHLLFSFKVPTRLISKSLDLYSILLSDDPVKKNNKLNSLFDIVCSYMETPTSIDNTEILIRYIFTLGDIGLVQYRTIASKFQQYLIKFFGKIDQTCGPTAALQSIVVLTIGKLSIVDEQFACKAVVLFGEILRKMYHPSTKINVLTVLFDLCKTSASLVEEVIPEMCICLKADSLRVKRVALKTLINLILEKYIKLKNATFFALLCMHNDTDSYVHQEIASFVNYLIMNNKDRMERKIIDVVLHSNGYKGRQTFYDLAYTNPEWKAFFSMEGDSKKTLRYSVYRFMLQHTTYDICKLKLMMRIFNIVVDIVANIVQDACEVTNNGIKTNCATQVIKDCFWILNSKEMTLTYGKLNDNNEDDPEMSETITVMVKKRVGIEKYKIVIIEDIIPNVLKVKYYLDRKNRIFPSVINDLRDYVCKLVEKSPFKDEIIEQLSVDSELTSEILHMRKQMECEIVLEEHEIDKIDDNDNDHGDGKAQDLEEQIPNEKNDLQEATVADCNQTTSETKSSSTTDFEYEHEPINVSLNNEEVPSCIESQSSNNNSNDESTDVEDDDLPGYLLFN